MRLHDAGVLQWADLLWLDSLLDPLADHDPISATHSFAVAVIAYWLARMRGHDLVTQATVFMGAATHDVGKMKVPATVLRATPTDWEANKDEYWPLVQEHVWHGYRILKKETNRFAAECAMVALCHHMDQDRGYPLRLVLPIREVWKLDKISNRQRLFYAVAGDNLSAAGRQDHTGALADGSAESLDIDRSPIPVLTREARMERLIKRAPAIGDLIRLAFDGDIVV